MPDLTGGTFQVWDYSPSLSRLLIRSLRKNQSELNIDIIFFGVQHINLKTLLHEISIQAREIEGDYQKFLIQSVEGLFEIQAVSYVMRESDTDIFESPLNEL